jgi:hypothetical protein
MNKGKFPLPKRSNLQEICPNSFFTPASHNIILENIISVKIYICDYIGRNFATHQSCFIQGRISNFLARIIVYVYLFLASILSKSAIEHKKNNCAEE